LYSKVLRQRFTRDIRDGQAPLRVATAVFPAVRAETSVTKGGFQPIQSASIRPDMRGAQAKNERE
jgi:hypothetical protein